MFYECCVCKSSRKDAILHHFPCSETRLIKWLKCLNRDDLAKLSPEKLSKMFICHKHFEKKLITPKSRLICAAYPSLFTQDEISSGIPSQENTENMDPQEEHNYSRKRHYDHDYCLQENKKETLGSVDIIPSTSGIARYPLLDISHDQPHAGQDTTCGSLDRRLLITMEPIPSTSAMTKDPLLDNQPHITHKSPLQFDAIDAVTTCNPLDGQSQVPVTGLYKVRSAKGPKDYRRRRLVTKVKDLTPTCRRIYTEFKKSKRQADFYQRAKKALKFNKEKMFQKLTANMNPYAKRIMKMQIKLCTKHKKGRRFTTQEKLIALSIMKQSPKCYRFLHKIFILPSRSTLNKMVARLKIQSGICPQIFELMKKEIGEWDEKKKMCSVVFDEMSLETGLTYDKNRDSMNGLVELNHKKNEFADHALVFMLRGAVHKWQQPIAFYFCQGATKGAELKNILRDIVSAVAGCGLKPIAVICDQGTAFQSVLKSLKEDTTRDRVLANQAPDDTITISGVNLKIVFDPPHLIKGLRNNFLTKNILLDGNISKWSDIIDVYETDCNLTEARLLHKLNDRHVYPEKIKKMKVKNCVKVFSKTVAAALNYTAKFSHYADGRPVSETIKNTAETVLFFDQLFDSVNGAAIYPKKKGKILRTAVTEKSPHHEFWRNSIEKVEKMKYIDTKNIQKSVPSLKNFVITLKSLMGLWQFFKSKNLRIMRPRYFNSDPIEIFFGQVRAYNYRNNDPNCHSFICTFKSLLITRIIKFHNDTFNCEDDPADQIINLQSLFAETEVSNVEPGHPMIGNMENIVEQARRERLNVHSRAYTAGWVVRKTLNKFKGECDSCKKSLTTEKGDIHKWVSQREYTAARDRLVYPSEGAVMCFGTIVKETNGFLEHNANADNISSQIIAKIMSENPFHFFDCTEHKTVLGHFIALTVRFTIMNWCNSINKILKGTDVVRLKDRTLPAMQKKAFEKFKKRLKNKSFNK